MIVPKLNIVLSNLRQTTLPCTPTARILQKRYRDKKPSEVQSRRFSAPAGTPGSGAGKGGGAGGSVRESGGGLGKYGAAQEESYFYDKQKEDLKKIKKKLKDKPDASDKSDK